MILLFYQQLCSQHEIVSREIDQYKLKEIHVAHFWELYILKIPEINFLKEKYPTSIPVFKNDLPYDTEDLCLNKHK